MRRATMRNNVFEIIETSGRDTDKVLGYLQLSGAEPIYLPVECKQVLDADGDAGWMGVNTFRDHVGRTLSDLRLRRIS
jgi:hypothetical protein